MFRKGLISISFRRETPENIIRYAADAGIECIEWGADVHCPPEQTARLREVCRLTREAGLETGSYGTYFRLGTAQGLEAFKRLCEAAQLLDAQVLRIWGGAKGSEDITVPERSRLAEQARELTVYAFSQGLYTALECHPYTVTDDWKSSLEFLEECFPEKDGKPGLWMYWQPNQFKSLEYNLTAAKKLAPYTVNMHVFNWTRTEKLPMAEGIDNWNGYISAFHDGLKDAGDLWGSCRGMHLEFMPDDRIESLKTEAETLKQLVKRAAALD